MYVFFKNCIRIVLELSEIQKIFFELDTLLMRVLRIRYIRVFDMDILFKRSILFKMSVWVSFIIR